MHSQIMPPKLALNSCCSLKCNAFILCIHTWAGCLGDTQSARTYVTEMLEGMTTMETWRNEDESLYWCVTKREHKKQVADELEETRHCYSTYKYCSGQVHQKGTKHKNTANMHRQWKLTVNSQNRVAMTQPRYRTQTSYIFNSQPSGEELNTSHLLQHTQTRTVASDVTVQTPMRTDRKKGIQHAQQVVHTGGRTHRYVSTPQRAFLSHSAGRKFFKEKKNGVTFSA